MHRRASLDREKTFGRSNSDRLGRAEALVRGEIEWGGQNRAREEWECVFRLRKEVG